MTRAAFYSAQAALFCGTVTYLRESGGEVECTAIYDTREDGESGQHRYGWPDRQYVGQVVEFVRRNHYGLMGQPSDLWERIR